MNIHQYLLTIDVPGTQALGMENLAMRLDKHLRFPEDKARLKKLIRKTYQAERFVRDERFLRLMAHKKWGQVSRETKIKYFPEGAPHAIFVRNPKLVYPLGESIEYDRVSYDRMIWCLHTAKFPDLYVSLSIYTDLICGYWEAGDTLAVHGKMQLQVVSDATDF